MEGIVTMGRVNSESFSDLHVHKGHQIEDCTFRVLEDQLACCSRAVGVLVCAAFEGQYAYPNVFVREVVH